LLLVAVLFVWRNAVPFIPHRSTGAGDSGMVTGRGAAEGFSSLLKRSLPPNRLIEECVTEWKRATGRRVKPALLPLVEAAAGSGVKQPVQTYQAIAKILNEKK